MLLLEPYDFSMLEIQDTSQIKLAINRYITTEYGYIKQNELVKFSEFSNHQVRLTPVILYGMTDIEKDIPAFNHIVVNHEYHWVALDLRQHVTVSKDRQSYTVKNEYEYNLILTRFVLSCLWLIEKQSSLYSFTFPHLAYGAWISDNLTKKFGLNLGDSVKLNGLSLLYYANTFTDHFDRDDFDKLKIRCKNAMVFPELMDEIYLKAPTLESTEAFCDACYAVTDNVRLKGMSPSVLLNIVNNNWFGLNGKELSLLSIEHPPTWISLVYASLTQKSFKKNYITSIVDKTDRRGTGSDFVKSLSNLMEQYRGA